MHYYLINGYHAAQIPPKQKMEMLGVNCTYAPLMDDLNIVLQPRMQTSLYWALQLQMDSL
jgi:hypothetical protein